MTLDSAPYEAWTSPTNSNASLCTTLQSSLVDEMGRPLACPLLRKRWNRGPRLSVHTVLRSDQPTSAIDRSSNHVRGPQQSSSIHYIRYPRFPSCCDLQTVSRQRCLQWWWRSQIDTCRVRQVACVLLLSCAYRSLGWIWKPTTGQYSWRMWRMIHHTRQFVAFYNNIDRRRITALSIYGPSTCVWASWHLYFPHHA